MIQLPQQSSKWYQNQKKAGEGIPCILCGKGVVVTKPHWDLIVVSGSEVARSDEEAEQYEISRGGMHVGDYGLHPIGPDCLKKHPQLKEYAIRSEGWNF